VRLVPLPSLDLYREPDPFRVPRRDEFRDLIDLLEFGIMCTAGFPEPLTFTLRAWRHLRARRDDYDVVHDNQSLGYGLLGIRRLGLPVVATIHHPITVDRELELAAATGCKQLSLRRWYGFARMQRRVAPRLDATITVSDSSAADIRRAFPLPHARLQVVPIGVDAEVFRPEAAPARVPGRVVTTASADVPLKGLLPLVEALAKVRTEHDPELVVVGKPRPGGRVERALRRLDLTSAVRFVSGLSDAELAALLASAQVAVVPSLYEGFSLPAVEAMACGTALVATTGGALPEVAGRDGDAALLVPPNDADALAVAIGRVLADARLRERLGQRGRARVLERFTWSAAAAATADIYRTALRDRKASAC
jgi:glycosyltransferase involved in cell wall biosynthesis